MSFDFGGGSLPDWQELKHWLGKELPRKLMAHWQQQDGGAWLERAARQWLQPEERETWSVPLRTADVRANVRRSARRITVKVRLPAGTDMRRLRLLAGADRLRVTGLPGGRVRTIRFPCRVVPRSGRASVRGGIVTVRFRRRAAPRREVELFIRP